MKTRKMKGSRCEACGAPVKGLARCETCGGEHRGDRSQVQKRKGRRKRYHSRGSRP